MLENESPYETLANAIVILAAKDYRRALRTLKHNPRNLGALSDKINIERFFHSKWFAVLTNVNAHMLLTRLKEVKR